MILGNIMLEYLIDDSYVSEGDRIAVGVSGGADSMLLLWALMDKRKQVKFDIHVINVNHKIRGKESDKDSAFVKSFCEKKKIDCTVVEVDAKKYKASEKVTLEESARKLRFDAFYDVMKKEKLNKLFLAHNKNDQAETILMHIFRGSGLAGAIGIKERDNIYRPLINLTKSEIYQLAKEHGITYVEDSTNSDVNYTRNFLRNKIIPEIQTKYPNVVDAITRFGERCAEIYDYHKSTLNLDLIDEDDGVVVIKSEAFQNPNFIVAQYLGEAFAKLGNFSDIEEKHIQKIIELSCAEVNKSVDLPHNLKAKSTYSGIKIFKNTKKHEAEQNEMSFIIGKLELNGYVIETSFIKSDKVEYGDGTLYVDYSKIPVNSVWRSRELGDMFSKLGTGSKKLNDYFTDKKIDYELRDKLPILASESQVLVVAPNDVSEKVKIDGNTEQIVRIKFSKQK